MIHKDCFLQRKFILYTSSKKLSLMIKLSGIHGLTVGKGIVLSLMEVRVYIRYREGNHYRS